MKKRKVVSAGAVLVTPWDIRGWRLRRGWYQSTVATRFGVSTRTVSRWESGASYPPPLVCETVAKDLGHPLPTIVMSLARAPRS
jgi:transcriptional regulator with XRE-family HTH domain